MTSPAVVTGIGIVAPNGVGTGEYWAAALAGTSGIAGITRFDPRPYPVRLAGEVAFDAAAHIPPRLMVQTDRWTHLGLYAAELALADAGADVSSLPEYEMAVVTASSSGGTEFGQREIEKLWRHGPDHVGAYQSIAWFYAATTGQLSIRNQMRGPCGVIATEQAGGLDALAQARRLLRSDARLVLAGGTDASLCPYGLVAQLSTGLLSRCDDPARAYLPFGADACGYVPGEGGAMLIVEDAAQASARGGPPPYGELAGYAAGFDPPPGAGRPPVLASVIAAALADAALAPSDIGAVFADAAGVPELDAAEADAISSVFGHGGVPVTAPKSLTGRLYAGGAALDTATALLALRHGVIPPTAGAGPVAGRCRQIDLVRGTPRPAELRAVLVIARGFSGFTAAVVLCTPRQQDAGEYARHQVSTIGTEENMRLLTGDDLKLIMCACVGMEETFDLDGDTLDLTYAELGYDSLAVMEIQAQIGRMFGIPLDDDATGSMPTPGRTISYVNGLIQAELGQLSGGQPEPLQAGA